MTSLAPRIGVVGGGLAGLAAAVTLKRHGAHVSVHERTRLLGGKATSYRVGDVEVDNGQHVVLACCTAFLDFVDELGCRSSLHVQPRFEVRVLRRGRASTLRESPLPAPVHLMPSFARYRHLGWRDKVLVARALLAARSERTPTGDLAGWLRRHRQTPATRSAFWDPFLVPALNAELEECSAEAGLFVIRTAFLASRGAARIGYTTVPLERVARAAAERVDALHMRSGVASVEPGIDGVTLRLDSGASHRYDAVVLAVPPRRLAAMLGEAEQIGVHGLDGFRTAPIVDVHLWYDAGGHRVLGASGFAAVLDSPVQWVFEKAPGYLCCSLSAARTTVTQPDDALVALCVAELSRAIPTLRSFALLRGAATRDADATFVPAPGLQRPAQETAASNVVLAGAWTDTGWPATMESAVRSGRLAAAVLERNGQLRDQGRERGQAVPIDVAGERLAV